MIDNLLTLESITAISIKNNNADKILIEKALRAFSLLEGLAEQHLDFVFKGGTSLILLLGIIKRLSIDIDIIIEKIPENFDTLLENIVQNKGFIKVLNQARIPQTNVPKTHYKFYYNSIITNSQPEDNILLDILFEKPHYNTLELKTIKFPLFPHDSSQIKVKVPSVEDILGDKLTAFAPNTTGIPYFKNDRSMSMEIIKQLYDIANLFDVAADLNIIKSTFINFATIELGYRNQSTKSYADVAEDVYNTALCITLRGNDGNGNFNELQNGINRVSRFIISENYHIEKAIVHAAKAAYMAALIKNEADVIEKFTDPSQIYNWIIEPPLNSKLNKLKKSNAEAFFYWYKTSKLGN